jgi:glucose-6-phosphate isomerase
MNLIERPLDQRPEWTELARRQRQLEPVHVGALFDADPRRSQRWTYDGAGLSLDLSRNRIDDGALAALLALARAAGVEGRRDAMLSGAIVNDTEKQPAWHSALRSPPADLANAGVAAELAAERRRFLDFAQGLRAGGISNSAGQPIESVICIGIGGSDLGPRLATEALGPASGPRLHFAANLDSADLGGALAACVPATTLVICVSKSFSTLETLENFRAAIGWLRSAGAGVDLASRLAAVTSRPDRCDGFGIDPQRVFTFPAWVGGRYSLWSACGIGIAIAHGAPAFEELLAGAAAMDAHFARAPLESNLPVLAGLLGIWYVNFWNRGARAIVPYAHRLRHLPAYLQQLEMESLGKRVDRAGAALTVATGPVVWGEVGSNAQHSVFQWLHQSPDWVPLDFVLVGANDKSEEPRLRLLNRFARAQADALAWGDRLLEAGARPPHLAGPGNRPSTLIGLDVLGARSTGALLAFYEHRTFVQSAIWNINAFDQFGVEIGKQLMARRS